MMVVAKELFLDLTEQSNPQQLLLQARRTALNGDVRELTLISDLDHAFSARELAQILHQASRLQSLSLFSVALTGSPSEFAEFAEALRRHRALKEVHLVDCGMMSTSIGMDSSGLPEKFLASNVDGTAGGTHSGLVVQVPPSVVPMPVPPADRPMDAILTALSQIPTLENVEIYAVPAVDDDGSYTGCEEDDDDDDDLPAATGGPTNGGGGEVPVAVVKTTTAGAAVPMDDEEDPIDEEDEMDDILNPLLEDSVTEDDENDDSMMDDDDDDENRDIRGIPASRPGRCTNRNIMALHVSPLCFASLSQQSSLNSLTSLSLEDLPLLDEHIVEMCRALAGNTVMKNLKLWGCNIGNSGCFPLAQMLQVNKSLEKLDLSHNFIEDDGCIAIAAALRFNLSLRWLCLMGNDCTRPNNDTNSDGRCYEALSELLQQNSVIENLILEAHETEESDLPAVVFVPVPE